MMKRILKVTLLVLLALFAVNSLVLAKKTKLNLKLFDSPPDFSSEVSSASGIMGTRYKPNEGGGGGNPSNILPIPPEPKLIPLTPDKAKVYIAAPLFEWDEPLCRPQNKCFVDVIADGITVIDHVPLENNSYLFDGDLLPGTTYEFKLTNFCEKTPLSFKLNFYVLDEEKQQQIVNDLSKIQAEDDYSKKILELELLYKNAIWFDVVSRLNELMKEYPDDQTLIDFKQKLYQTVQK